MNLITWRIFNLSIEFTLVVLILILVGYLLGSIPFGLLITKFFGTEDIRNIGSGNIGATNVLRTGKKWLAFLTLILDGFKGYFSIFLTTIFLNNLNEISFFFVQIHSKNLIISFVSFFSIIGHCFPIWLKFKGGKGVATGFGVLLYFDVLIAFCFLIFWVLIFLAFRISSLSSLITFLLVPAVLFYFQKDFSFVIATFGISIIVFLKHKDNIIRLIRQEEKTFKK